MADYRVIFEDPQHPDHPVGVLVPSDDWLEEAKAGLLPHISVYWALQDDEQAAIIAGRHDTFTHDPEKYAAQWSSPRIGPLTEEKAMEYLIMKDIPRHIWSQWYNRPMLKIVRKEEILTDRSFRNAWRLRAA